MLLAGDNRATLVDAVIGNVSAKTLARHNG
jgi:hypothetical protein